MITTNSEEKELAKEHSKILLAGATGDLGTKITGMLLQQNIPVRCLVRNQSKYQSLLEAGANIVFGDLKDQQSLEKACQDTDVVITTANTVLRGEPDNIQTVDLDGNRKLVDAAKKAGIKQFIFVSTNVANPNSPVPLLKAKGKTEEYLQKSGLIYTVLAPNAFMDFWILNVVGIPAIKGQPVFIVGNGQRKHSFVSATDVAKFAAASVNNPKAFNQRLVIGGPDALSFVDAIGVYERLLNRRIQVTHVAPMEPIPAFTENDSLAPFAANLLPIAASFEMFDSPMDMTELLQKFNIKLTNIEEFATKTIADAI